MFIARRFQESRGIARARNRLAFGGATLPPGSLCLPPPLCGQRRSTAARRTIDEMQNAKASKLKRWSRLSMLTPKWRSCHEKAKPLPVSGVLRHPGCWCRLCLRQVWDVSDRRKPMDAGRLSRHCSHRGCRNQDCGSVGPGRRLEAGSLSLARRARDCSSSSRSSIPWPTGSIPAS